MCIVHTLQVSFVVDQEGIRVYPGRTKSRFQKLNNGSYHIFVEQLYPNITYTLKVWDVNAAVNVLEKFSTCALHFHYT